MNTTDIDTLSRVLGITGDYLASRVKGRRVRFPKRTRVYFDNYPEVLVWMQKRRTGAENYVALRAVTDNEREISWVKRQQEYGATSLLWHDWMLWFFNLGKRPKWRPTTQQEFEDCNGFNKYCAGLLLLKDIWAQRKAAEQAKAKGE